MVNRPAWAGLWLLGEPAPTWSSVSDDEGGEMSLQRSARFDWESSIAGWKLWLLFKVTGIGPVVVFEVVWRTELIRPTLSDARKFAVAVVIVSSNCC